eukprot:TRINITY_DN5771_c0_g4_i2.p1 TRINITY_DN5771_c0_g4~~TRINITY_DN5771_c0_g4_i2.p1  ORF type:complete len:197 (+),score=61.22 TRINITY_DN5771_c0_g4_i2:321-911(+)
MYQYGLGSVGGVGYAPCYVCVVPTAVQHNAYQMGVLQVSQHTAAVPATAAPSACIQYAVDVYFKYNRSAKHRSATPVAVGALVITEGDRGYHMGVVASCRAAAAMPADTPVVLRLATESEQDLARKNTQDEEEAALRAQEVLDRHNINIKIRGAEFQLDRKKLTFFITSEDSVTPQFKPVLGELYSIWKCRVWFSA